jgi:hypothetical protein
MLSTVSKAVFLRDRIYSGKPAILLEIKGKTSKTRRYKRAAKVQNKKRITNTESCSFFKKGKAFLKRAIKGSAKKAKTAPKKKGRKNRISLGRKSKIRAVKIIGKKILYSNKSILFIFPPLYGFSRLFAG